mgnify:CR=1 FL=1
MKKLAILVLGVLSLVACTDQKVVNYNTARLDVIEDYLRNHKYVKPSENFDKLVEEGKIEINKSRSLEKQQQQNPWRKRNK